MRAMAVETVIPFLFLLGFMRQERDFHHVCDVGVLADFHVCVDSVLDFVPIQGLKRTEQAIPNRENVAIIGVGVGLNIVVMYFVHVRRDNKIANGVIEPLWHHDICVIELGENHA